MTLSLNNLKIKPKHIFILCSLFSFHSIHAQKPVSPDSLNTTTSINDIPDHNLPLSGYGEVIYQNNFTDQIANINLARAVLFVGHTFNKNISFYSELEVEDAKVSGGETGGEVALEQAFLTFKLRKGLQLNAGLFIPRIGLINQRHLPVEFNGCERPVTETIVIPSTWREIGIGIEGNPRSLRKISYTISLVNGLNAEGFENGTGIREGRMEGRNAPANNAALTGSVLYFGDHIRIQTSGYFGGSFSNYTPHSDSMNISHSPFSLPVFLGEVNVTYEKSGWEIKGLFSTLRIPEADKINDLFDNNTPTSFYGGYFEAGYNVLQKTHFVNTGIEPLTPETRRLIIFCRYEFLDMSYQIPHNFATYLSDPQMFLFAGLAYHPVGGVVIKADYKIQRVGQKNTGMHNFLNVGLGYSF